VQRKKKRSAALSGIQTEAIQWIERYLEKVVIILPQQASY
jgi:hypothetical protein